MSDIRTELEIIDGFQVLKAELDYDRFYECIKSKMETMDKNMTKLFNLGFGMEQAKNNKDWGLVANYQLQLKPLLESRNGGIDVTCSHGCEDCED